jgi:hypothetical protein
MADAGHSSRVFRTPSSTSEFFFSELEVKFQLIFEVLAPTSRAQGAQTAKNRFSECDKQIVESHAGSWKSALMIETMRSQSAFSRVSRRRPERVSL